MKVGLMNDMEESIRRFNIVLGVEFKDECRKQYFVSRARHLAVNDSGQTQGAIDNMNSNPHPKVIKQDFFADSMSKFSLLTNFLPNNLHCLDQVVEGSLEYRILAERNSFDMVLYDYITLLYEEQKSLIYSYATA